MLGTLLAISLLIPYAFYALAMIVLWAVLVHRLLRIGVLFTMGAVPIGLGAHTALEARTVLHAKDRFVISCGSAPQPVVRARAQELDSIHVSMRGSPQTAADRHAALVFPSGDTVRHLLEGAERYARLERPALGGGFEAIERRDIARPIKIASPTSSHSIEWRHVETLTPFVTAGTLVVQDVRKGEVLAERRTQHFHSDPVVLLGGKNGMRVLPSIDISCPTSRQIAQWVKSVARPSTGSGR